MRLTTLESSNIRQLLFHVFFYLFELADIDHEARDASLHNKLFVTGADTIEDAEYERDVHLDSPAPRTPDMVCIPDLF